MASNDELAAVMTSVVESLVLQLIDMNSILGDIHNRLAGFNAKFNDVVDELRTLNSAAGRIEDHISYRP